MKIPQVDPPFGILIYHETSHFGPSGSRSPARSVDGELLFGSPDAPTSLLAYVLSTITSPVFSEVAVFYRDYDFRGIFRNLRAPGKPTICWMSPDKMVEDALWTHRRFEVFREMGRLRDFRLVLCADVWGGMGKYSVRVPKDAVATEKAKGGVDNLSSEPTVVYSPRASRPEFLERCLATHPCYWALL